MAKKKKYSSKVLSIVFTAIFCVASLLTALNFVLPVASSEISGETTSIYGKSLTRYNLFDMLSGMSHASNPDSQPRGKALQTYAAYFANSKNPSGGLFTVFCLFTAVVGVIALAFAIVTFFKKDLKRFLLPIGIAELVFSIVTLITAVTCANSNSLYLEVTSSFWLTCRVEIAPILSLVGGIIATACPIVLDELTKSKKA